MKPSEVYLRAAKEVDGKGRDFCSCWAIWTERRVGDGGEALSAHYADYFAPTGAYRKEHGLAAFWLFYGEPDPIPQEDRNDWRVLALLFMHQIAKDEEARK